MGKEETIKVKGIVREIYPGSMCKVELCDEKGNPTGNSILAKISGKLRVNYIKILREDKVDVELSVYDVTNGRITWRYR